VIEITQEKQSTLELETFAFGIVSDAYRPDEFSHYFDFPIEPAGGFYIPNEDSYVALWLRRHYCPVISGASGSTELLISRIFPLIDGLTLEDKKMIIFAQACNMIANGHHSKPRIPEELTSFKGELIHSHLYKTNKLFSGKKVLVVGAGNSGCDCAVEISRVAEYTAISVRNPQYIIPKFFLGKPTDTFNKGMAWLPTFLSNPLRRLAVFIQVGRYKDYGLPEPDFAVTKVHPTLNSELLYKIRHGKVAPRTGIKKIENKEVYFQDGKHENFDTIIAATGYKISFPFFSKQFIQWEEGDKVPLYLRMFHPDYKNLIFIGLFQPQGAVWPLSDYQAKLAAKYILKKWKPEGDVKSLAEKDANDISKEFLSAKRHTIEVHYQSFMNKLKKELRKNKFETV
jgi:hypothetical protein